MALFRRVFGARELPKRLSYEDARSVLERHERALEAELAARPDAEREMLYYLAERGQAPSRRAAAANPNTPAEANRFLAEDSDDEVRAELARKIGRLLPDLLAPERDRVCQLTLEALQRLANDQLPRVRYILAEEIKSLACVPREIVLGLARDVEQMVSAPILEYSPLLSDNDLLEIVASARAQHTLAAIAKRRGLNPQVSDAIVASLDIPAVAALLANPDARIREETMEKIIDHAKSISSWHGPLVMRTDLSVRALRRIGGFVGASLLERLCTRHGLDNETREHLQRALRRRLERDEDAAAAEDRAQAEVERARDTGVFDERYVEEAVESGRRDVVIAALSLLVHAPKPVVERILASRSAKAITALVWHAGLTMRIAFKIQTLLVKLPANELLPARSGFAFPLTEEDMRWHLSYFGFAETK